MGHSGKDREFCVDIAIFHRQLSVLDKKYKFLGKVGGKQEKLEKNWHLTGVEGCRKMRIGHPKKFDLPPKYEVPPEGFEIPPKYNARGGFIFGRVFKWTYDPGQCCHQPPGGEATAACPAPTPRLVASLDTRGWSAEPRKTHRNEVLKTSVSFSAWERVNLPCGNSSGRYLR